MQWYPTPPREVIAVRHEVVRGGGGGHPVAPGRQPTDLLDRGSTAADTPVVSCRFFKYASAFVMFRFRNEHEYLSCVEG